MNITVINGTEKHGVTYRLKEMFLAEFKDKANITEYYLSQFLQRLYKLYAKRRKYLQRRRIHLPFTLRIDKCL